MNKDIVQMKVQLCLNLGFCSRDACTLVEHPQFQCDVQSHESHPEESQKVQMLLDTCAEAVQTREECPDPYAHTLENQVSMPC